MSPKPRSLEPIEHDLKTWCEPFARVRSRQKKYEIRKNDRQYMVGDTLKLREWDHTTETYTGEVERVVVTWISYGGVWGLPEELCVMSIEPCPNEVSPASLPGTSGFGTSCICNTAEEQSGHLGTCPARQRPNDLAKWWLDQSELEEAITVRDWKRAVPALGRLLTAQRAEPAQRSLSDEERQSATEWAAKEAEGFINSMNTRGVDQLDSALRFHLTLLLKRVVTRHSPCQWCGHLLREPWPGWVSPQGRCLADHWKERKSIVAAHGSIRGYLDGSSPPRAEPATRSSGTHYFPMPEAAKCRACGGDARVELTVGRSGFTIGSGHAHAEDCPTQHAAEVQDG